MQYVVAGPFYFTGGIAAVFQSMACGNCVPKRQGIYLSVCRVNPYRLFNVIRS